MRHTASALGLVVLGLAAPAIVSIGCGGAEWKPVAGPTVFPVMPSQERNDSVVKRGKRSDSPPTTLGSAAAPLAATSASAAPAASGSAKPGASAAKPKAPPPPAKKKLERSVRPSVGQRPRGGSVAAPPSVRRRVMR